MRRTHHWFPRLLAIAALAALPFFPGCGGAPPAPPAGGVAVTTIAVETQDVTLTAELSGRLAPCRVAEIRPQVNGVVQERLFEEGAAVVAGQLLYRIDPAPYQAALDAAEASLARSEAGLEAARARKERVEGLLPSKAASQQDVDDARAQFRQVEADIAAWRAQAERAAIELERTEVRSPIPGRIGRSGVTEGATVTAYQPQALATVRQLDPIYLDMPQASSELQRLRRELEDGSLVGDPGARGNVRIELEDGTPYPHAGTLQFREVFADPSTATVILRATFPNPDQTLLPDQFVRATLVEGVNRGAVLIPQQAVARDPKGSPFAWIVDEQGLAQMRRLVLDRAIGDRWVVLEGLAAGESLVVEGLQRLRRPGTPVQATPFAPQGAAAGSGR